MMSNPIQFFTNYLANNRLVKWFFDFRKIFSKGLIDHCLVPISCFIRSCTEIIEDVRIKIHCHYS